MMRLYFNGTLVGSLAYSTPISYPAASVRLRVGQGVTFHYRGLMDELKIFDRPLTPDQVLGTALIPQMYTQTSGSTVVRGGTLMSGPTLNTVQIQGGTLSGAGTVDAHVVNSGGTMAPGNSPGFLDVTGNYSQSAAGTLALEMAGRNAGTPEFDRLRVTGTTTLNGTVNLTLLNGFQPSAGEEFRVISSALRSGAFTVHAFPPPGGVSRRIDPLYDATGLSLITQIVPPLEFIAATTGADGSPAGGQMIPHDVALDSAGNAIVVGSFRGTVDFDREHAVAGDTLTSTDTDAFLAKYDVNGQLVWVARLDGGTRAEAFGVAVDRRGTATAADDRIFVTGDFAANADFKLGGVSQGLLTGPGTGSHGFVLQADAGGNLIAARAITNPGGPTDSTVGRRVAVKPSGDVVITGSFNAATDFQTGGTAVMLTPAGSSDAFVRRHRH
jgi:hypothetical protein